MLILEYAPHGPAVSDFRAMDYAKDLAFLAKDTETNTAQFSNAMVLDALRVLICRGELSHEQIELRFENRAMYIDQYANLSDWPRGFCDQTENYLMEILKWGSN